MTPIKMYETYKDDNYMFLSFIAIWIVLSLLSFGYSFTFFRTEYADFKNHKKAYWGDLIACLCMSVIGSISVVVICLLGYTKHGIKFGSLSRDYEGFINETRISDKGE